jgi:hypothetical protein
MHCIFIHGPVASGKLTVAKELQKLSALPIHHNHLAVDAALSLFPFGSEPFVRMREQLWRTAFQEAALADQSFIFTFAPEATVRRGLVDELVQIVEGVDGRVLFVELTCSAAEIAQRIEGTDRARHGKLLSLELYQELREQGAFQFPPLPTPVICIDTGKVAAGEAATAIHTKVRSLLSVKGSF